MNKENEINSSSKIYVAIDGDDVGRHLEYLMLTNNTEELVVFSHGYEQAMQWLSNKFTDLFRATIIFSGGDNILLIIDESNLEFEILSKIKIDFTAISNKTLSIGLGHSARQAYFALKLAKTSGKNCIKWFKELRDA